MGAQPTSDDEEDMIVCPHCMATFKNSDEGREAFDGHDCDPPEPPTCSECDAPATHEARRTEEDQWTPLCEDHALGAFEWDHKVLRRREVEA